MVRAGIAGVPSKHVLDACIADGSDVVDLDVPLLRSKSNNSRRNIR